jgi:glycosyltransferase involved in cell wall biosynthesis
MGALGAIAGRIAGVKHIIFTAHGWPYLEQRPLWWKLAAWIGSWPIVALSNKIIAVSDYDLRTAPVIFLRDKLIHIDNGITPFSLKTREDARASLGKRNHDLSKYSCWLIMNAELHPNKGISTAIRALAELAPRHADLALVVCGEGEDRQRLTDLAWKLGVASRVFLLGFVEDAREYLAAGDIYLMPSRKEGMPLALLEAGLASLPVIATKVGGIPDIVDDQKTGLFMPRGNTHILTKAIAYLINNSEEAARMGAALEKKVRTEFSAEHMIASTLALY